MAANGGSLIYVDKASVLKLQHVAKAIKAQGDSKALTKMLNAEIREAVKPLLTDLQQAARGVTIQGGGEGPSRQARRTGRTLKSGKFKSGRGLRESVSFGLRTQISKGANTAAVRIRLASKDPAVNRLGKRMEKGSIRHPLFGNRDRWYVTRTSKGWFYGTAKGQLPIVQKRVERVLDKFTADLAHKVDRAA